jgi:diguanylate cyclase (GGDEF)-like protein/PAS domain S-box-containing protein
MRLVRTALGLMLMSAAASLLNHLSSAQGGVSVIWLSNGLLIGVLLCSPRRQWPVFFCVGIGIDFVVNIVLHTPPGYAVYLTFCNMVEVYVASQLMYPAISEHADLTKKTQIRSFLLYGVVLAPMVAASLAVFGLQHFLGTTFLKGFQYWFAADMLGVATVTPLYLSYYYRQKFSPRSLPETVALILLLAAVTIFVFGITQAPLIWLVLLSLILLGARVGFTGSALGLLVVIFIGGYFTLIGRGPLSDAVHSSVSIGILLFQIFILSSMLALYLTEVSMAENRRFRLGLDTSEARFRLMAEASRDVIVLAGLAGERKYVSPAATEILGWSHDELLSGTFSEIVHPDDLSSFREMLLECREGNETGSLSYRCRRKDGTYIWLESNIRLYRHAVTAVPAGFVYILRDISERKLAECQLQEAFHTVEQLAMVDGLTGVANRRLLDETLTREWLRAIRDGSPISLLLIDVDYFKLFNDLYGHVAGDKCLQSVAAAIQNVLRRPQDLLARYGGEEFVVVLPNTPGSGAEVIAGKVMAAVEQCAILHSGNPHGMVTASLGCACAIATADSSPTELLKAADDAMYRAKAQGRNRIQISGVALIVN